MSCVMFVIYQLKFEHLNMRKPMALLINVLCDICQSKFEHLKMRKPMALIANKCLV
jgi:uncharacterized protein YutE (UPF0331/DUF86 family)